MADLSNPLTQVVVGQSQPATIVNNLIDALSPAAVFGQNDLTTSGLNWGYYGGRYRGLAIAHGTIALPASQASVYIVANKSSGVVSQSTVITNWNDTTNYDKLYLATTGSSTITDWDDYREIISSASLGAAVDTETIQDIVGALIIAGAGISVNYNDGDSPPTFSITNTTGVSLTVEDVQDIVGALLVGGANVTVTYQDGDSPPNISIAAASAPKVIQFACSDLTTALTTGNGKAVFRMPYAMTVTTVRASLGTTQSSGSIFTVDINEAGSTILSTKITIDNTETTSTTAATAPVISDSALADDAEITVDIDQVGDGTAKGLIVTLIGT